MKIFYWSVGWNNFGDELNPWLIPRMLPRIAFDEDESEYYVGIGTLLNTRLPQQGVKYVLGSGVGYGDAPQLDDSYRVYGVRGPRSCEALGIDPSRYALTDPAMLVPRVFGQRSVPTGRVAFMPHCKSAALADWAAICRSVGLDYINPMGDVESVIRAIAGAKFLITEALHGAIVADAFRIPWVPVSSNDRILEFKWHDWMASVGLTYAPYRVPEIVDGTGTTWIGRQKDRIKRIAIVAGFDSSHWTPPGKPLTGEREIDEARKILSELSRGDRAISSRDGDHAAAIGRIEAACERFQEDFAFSRETAVASAGH